ncbi:MAG: hypothetical protein IJZ54_08945 [Clostridia bacterium]|nr:hypothetical protein [Clostridia bacterium]
MADLIRRKYSSFRGCDFRGIEVNLQRSPDCLNVWKDYRATESICTRPGLYQKQIYSDPVYGVFFYKDEMIVHSGKKLYASFNEEEPRVLYDATELSEGVSNAFVFDDIWYFKDGRTYLKYDGSEIEEVEGYIPTTSIGRKPMGGGTKFEDVNFLSDFRKNSFLADGSSDKYYLDTKNIDTDYVPQVTVNDVTYVYDVSYTVNYSEGYITFKEAPKVTGTDGRDNVVIKFKKTEPGYRSRILNCSIVQIFDNRVFFSGNPERPTMIWHSSLNDPTYFSDLDYYREGIDSAPIRSLVAGNNALWVFREPSATNTTIFYHNPALDEEYGKVYPSVHSSITLGCEGKAINFNDDIVFFSERGMEGISGDITTEQAAAHRSTLIDSKLIGRPDYKDMVLVEWEGYLFVFIGNIAFLADSRAMFQNENHYEYEWFYWELEKPVYSATVYDGMLYLGTNDGVYSMSDFSADVESYWVTPVDKFQNPNKLKTTNKRGCVAEATGDISVYAKLEDTDFELIGEYKNIADYFVSRIKRKKFKDIQLKFYSSTRFSLETVTLECFIGGYIKR